MSAKTAFRAFACASFVLEVAQRVAVEDRLQDIGCKKTHLEIDTDQIICAFPAKIAFVAFSIELGLKSLLIDSKQDTSHRGHDLYELFGRLPDSIKRSIIDDVYNNSSDVGKTFDELLKENSKNFVKFRYFHENMNLSADLNFMGVLLCAIHNYTINNVG
jgi:hypothetical protein